MKFKVGDKICFIGGAIATIKNVGFHAYLLEFQDGSGNWWSRSDTEKHFKLVSSAKPEFKPHPLTSFFN